MIDSNRFPKFLTPKMASVAIAAAWSCVHGPQVAEHLNPRRTQGHVVVLVPSHTYVALTERDSYEFSPLFEMSFGGGVGNAEFVYPFDRIARSKAHQLSQDRNDGGTDIQAHLLFERETPFWGGVKRYGLVCACSGVQPHVDRAIAGMTIDLLVAMAREAWETSKDHADDELCFLTRVQK